MSFNSTVHIKNKKSCIMLIKKKVPLIFTQGKRSRTGKNAAELRPTE